MKNLNKHSLILKEVDQEEVQKLLLKNRYKKNQGTYSDEPICQVLLWRVKQSKIRTNTLSRWLSDKKKEVRCTLLLSVQGVNRSFLMTLCVIFPIHMNFPITPRCVLKATIHRKKVNCFTLLEKAFFSSKKRFYGIIHHVVFD